MSKSRTIPIINGAVDIARETSLHVLANIFITIESALHILRF